MNLYTRLINKDHPLPPDYVPENLTDIGIPFDAPCGDSILNFINNPFRVFRGRPLR